MKKFKVVELDHEIDYSKKKPITVWKSKKTILFRDKVDAWKHFNASVFPYWGKRDFLEDIDWNDEFLVTAHMDEGGCNNCILYKWEGFDDDIEIGWEYNGVLYRNLRELWKTHCTFKEMKGRKPNLKSDTRILSSTRKKPSIKSPQVRKTPFSIQTYLSKMPNLPQIASSGQLLGLGWYKLSSRLFGRAGEPYFKPSLSRALAKPTASSKNAS